MMMLLDQLHWWRLNRRSKQLIKQGITIRSEFPNIISGMGERDRVATAVNIGTRPALIVGFITPYIEGANMTCDRLYQIGWTTDRLPVFVAKKLRQVS